MSPATTKTSQHLARIAHPLRHARAIEVLQQRNRHLPRQAEDFLELTDVDRLAAMRGNGLLRAVEIFLMHVDAVREPDELPLLYQKSDDALDDFRLLRDRVDQLRNRWRLQAGVGEPQLDHPRELALRAA